MKHLIRLAVILGIVAGATTAEAQLFYIGLRGGAGIPTGSFTDSAGGTAENRVLAGAKTGFGYGLDLGVNLGPLGVYAGFDKIKFDCEEQVCPAETNYKLQGVSAGLRVSVPFFPLVKPWAKAGVTFNELEADFTGGGSSPQFSTERTPGYEIGAGLDIPLARIFSLTPQVRYIGQKLDYRIPGVTTGNTTEKAANYYTFDLGLRFRSPL